MPILGNKNKLELSPRLKFGVGRGLSQNKLLKISSVIFLAIALILGINAVRLVIGGTGQVNEPEVLGAQDIKNQTDPANVQYIEYQVTAGDTLFNISQKFGISWTTLATLNSLNAPFALKPGQILQIPK